MQHVGSREFCLGAVYRSAARETEAALHDIEPRENTQPTAAAFYEHEYAL